MPSGVCVCVRGVVWRGDVAVSLGVDCIFFLVFSRSFYDSVVDSGLVRE